MKKRTDCILPLWVVGLLCMTFACTPRSYPSYLTTADSLANHGQADSALALLELHQPQLSQASEAIQMHHRLLTIKAQDKAYHTHTSDSLIRTVVSYYCHHEDPNLLPEALYYAGRVYSDLGDTPRALEFFLKAAEKAEEAEGDAKNYDLLSRVYAQTGELFMYQDVYEKALPMFRKSYHYNRLEKDTTGLTYSLRDLGRYYATQEQADSALHYYGMAREYARHKEDSLLLQMVSSELCSYLMHIGRYEESSRLLPVLLEEAPLQRIPNKCVTLALYYEHKNMLDSAAYYYNLLQPVDDYLFQQAMYEGLGSIEQKRGEYRQASVHLMLALAYMDSVQTQMRTEAVSKVNAMFDYQTSKKELLKMKMESAKRKVFFVFISVVCALALATTIACWQYFKRKLQKKQVQQEKAERIRAEQEEKSQAQLEKNKQKIAELEALLQKAIDKQDIQSQNLLATQKEYIEKNNEQIEVLQKFQVQAEESLKQTPIYKKFKQACLSQDTNGKITKEDWQAFYTQIDTLYCSFNQRLSELYPMNDFEIKTCYLLKAGFFPAQISKLTNHSKQSVSSVRTRLYKKVFKQPASPEDWDKVIREL